MYLPTEALDESCDDTSPPPQPLPQQISPASGMGGHSTSRNQPAVEKRVGGGRRDGDGGSSRPGRVTHTKRQEMFSKKEQRSMGPDISEITRTPMQRTSLGSGDQWGWSGRSGRSPKVGRGRGRSDEEEGDSACRALY